MEKSRSIDDARVAIDRATWVDPSIAPSMEKSRSIDDARVAIDRATWVDPSIATVARDGSRRRG